MNKTISLIRIGILFILGTLAMIFITCEEQDENAWAFFVHFVADKGLGICLCFCIGGLYKKWSKVDPWLKAYDKMCDDVMGKSDTPQL